MESLGSRLRYIRINICNLKQKEFADLLSIPQDTLGRYERNAIKPSSDILILYTIKVDFNTHWLLTGKGNPLNGGDILQEEDVELCMIPLVSASLSAGNGSFEVEGNIEKHLAFRRDFLRSKGSIKDMVLMKVSGDSMEPEIKDRDTVLVDQSQKRFVANGIYAVGFGETIYLKKINALPNKIVLESINKKYEPITIELHDIEDSVRILGRAVWWCREVG